MFSVIYLLVKQIYWTKQNKMQFPRIYLQYVLRFLNRICILVYVNWRKMGAIYVQASFRSIQTYIQQLLYQEYRIFIVLHMRLHMLISSFTVHKELPFIEAIACGSFPSNPSNFSNLYRDLSIQLFFFKWVRFFCIVIANITYLSVSF